LWQKNVELSVLAVTDDKDKASMAAQNLPQPDVVA